jgi:Ca2+-binding EF-hand superfamily protein
MFQKLDQHRQGYLTKIQFNQLLKQFDIHLNEHEFYHLTSEIDKNQNGIFTYDELYYSLITDLLKV